MTLLKGSSIIIAIIVEILLAESRPAGRKQSVFDALKYSRRIRRPQANMLPDSGDFAVAKSPLTRMATYTSIFERVTNPLYFFDKYLLIITLHIDQVKFL